MMTFILIHGSWHNGSVWYRVEQELRQEGVSVFVPTLSGFESKDTPASKETGLKVHIQQIVDLIARESLHEVVLVGHSYSGLVISGVAEKMSEVSRNLFIWMPLFQMTINPCLILSDPKVKLTIAGW